MSKHTKGPWLIETYTDGMLQIIGDVRTVDEDCDEFTTVTEQVYGLYNARLIAAAPELLEALERLVSDFESEIHNEYDGTSMLSARLAECDYARAAIAKARGEA